MFSVTVMMLRLMVESVMLLNDDDWEDNTITGVMIHLTQLHLVSVIQLFIE